MAKQKIKAKKPIVKKTVVKEKFPMNRVIQDTQLECDKRISALKDKYRVEVSGLHNLKDGVKYILVLHKK